VSRNERVDNIPYPRGHANHALRIRATVSAESPKMLDNRKVPPANIRAGGALNQRRSMDPQWQETRVGGVPLM
jgi:hypothetical protein